ncbi:MAG: DUF4856 domain-containing protein [Candidatus Puniceispirillaceae bacterium]
MKYSLIGLMASVSVLSSQAVAGDIYGPYPITLKDYVGDKTNSVSYSGQVGRQLLHNSLKKAIGNGASLDEMNAYFNGSENELQLLDPKSSDSFKVDVTNINDVSKTNLSGKAFKGNIAGWPGNMSGKAVLENMIVKASQVEKGYDAAHGYDYAQLVSKFTMGAVFYHQACDNYLDEKLAADNKPNNKPYKDGAYYTGKEHSWDEGFGYWGAAAHGATLSPRQNYDIAKKKDMSAADINGDGIVNLKSEMNYAHAYYASAFDKGGQTNYYNTITQAFIDGRVIIANADGEALRDAERSDLQAHARTICSNWERVIAEAVFKYAGSVYADIEKLKANSGDAKAYRAYVKHWGELKGFALSLHTGKFSLGSIGAELDELIGFGPVLMNGTQVSGLDATGAYQLAPASVDEYMVKMLKVQNLMSEEFGVVAKNNDKLAGISNLAEALGLANSAEND